MMKKQKHNDWKAISLAAAGLITVATEAWRSYNKDVAHARVTAIQSITSEDQYRKIEETLEKQGEQIQTIRESIAGMKVMVDLLASGRLSAARRETRKVQEVIERIPARKILEVEGESIPIVPDTKKRGPSPARLMQRIQQLYEE